MRIRSTKPEFWRSERIASVSWDARLVLKGLESYVDDNGVGKDDVALIVGDVFPRDMLANPRETVERVSEAISDLHRAGLVHRYIASGTRLLCVAFWEQSQRIDKPGRGRFPRPDGTMDYKESEIRESVARARESVAPGTGEQGNRGTGELIGSPSVTREDEAHAETVSPETVLPRNLTPGNRHKAFALEHALNLSEEVAAFKDHARATGRTAVDWDAALMSWLRQSVKRTAAGTTRRPTTDDRVREHAQLVARLAADEHDAPKEITS
jgi:hypothetical protein